MQTNQNQNNHEDHGVLESLANNQTTFEQSPQNAKKEKDDEKEPIGRETSNPEFRCFY